METCMLIAVANETISGGRSDTDLIGQEGGEFSQSLTLVRRPAAAATQRREHYADGGIPVVDDRMRLPSFVETCPHVGDRIIPLNGGRFNMDHYLRVLRSKSEIDESIAMALTSRR
jgi:hypothetical protein